MEPGGPLPFVRVVVLNWNAAWYTARCLTSLRATSYPDDRFEVVMVDNGSVDGSLERLRHDFASVRLVENGANLGFAEGCNRAMRDLDDVDLVALVNNDAVVEPDWLRPLVDAMATDDRIGAACPKILLESPFVDVAVSVAGLPTDRYPIIQRVRLDGIDVTRRCLTDGVSVHVDVARPLQLVLELRRDATLRVPVAPSGDSRSLEVTVVDPGAGVTLGAADSEASVQGSGPQVVELSVGSGGVRRVNSLGTDLTAAREGIEIGFGSADDPDDRTIRDVTGWSGGGVLLRAAMLGDVGVFDPAYFAYYEDTDLAWRARRRGWRTVCVPTSVLHHAHGGTAGPTARPFFFLNYRNWLSTVLRNGTASDLRAAFGNAVHLAWRPFRHNVFGRLRRLRCPDVELTLAWLRVFAGVFAAMPGVLASRRRAVGSMPVDDVRSRWMPESFPRPPAVRTGGPLLVYVDVTETLRSGWRAGIQRVTCELVRQLPTTCPEIELVPIVWNRLHGAFRRVTAGEYAALLSPTQRERPHGPAPAPPRWRRVAGRAGRLVGLQFVAESTRRHRELRAEPELHRRLLLDHLEAGAVFLDVDAAWNTLTCRRADLLPALSAQRVRIVQVLCDILPITDFEWFEQHSARRFIEHVEAHAANAELVLAISQDTADQYGRWASSERRRIPPVAVVTLGTELPVDVDDDVPELPEVLQDARYLLTVGTIEPRKNHRALLEAYDDLHLDHPELHLVVVGREGWKAADVVDRLRRQVSTDDHVHWFHEATDAELAALYRGAFAVVTPSLAEGFGLPVVEAMGHGCVVLSSHGGALPEAGGDLAEYFDPRRPEELSKLVRRHLEDPTHHAAQLERVASVEPKRWSTVAREVGVALVGLRVAAP